MQISREQLYEEVWAKPMLQVAEQYGVSSSFMARVCRRLNVPCPPRGHWVKQKAGLRVKRPLLPPPEPGDELAWSRGWERAPRQPYPVPSTRATGPSKVGPITNRADGRHPHVLEAAAHFAGAKTLYNDYLRPSKRLVVDLYVTKATVSRAIETASQLFKVLEGKGLRVGFCPTGVYFHRPELKHCEGKDARMDSLNAWSPTRATMAFIGTMPLGLTLFEQSEMAEATLGEKGWVRVSDLLALPGRKRFDPIRSYTSTHAFATGRLALRAYSPYADVPWERTWVEPEAGKFPEMFEQIAGSLKTQASKLVPLVKEALEKRRIEEEERRAAFEAWARKQAFEEEQRRLAELERIRRKAIKHSKDELMGILRQWTRAKRVQAFLAEMERMLQETDTEDRAFLVNQVEEARVFLGSVDPLQLLKIWNPPEKAVAEALASI